MLHSLIRYALKKPPLTLKFRLQVCAVVLIPTVILALWVFGKP